MDIFFKAVSGPPVRMREDLYVRGTKTMKCPECGSENVIPIAYGYPSEEAWKEVGKGLVKFGGCTITGNDPDYFCRDCFHEFDLVRGNQSC